MLLQSHTPEKKEKKREKDSLSFPRACRRLSPCTPDEYAPRTPVSTTAGQIRILVSFVGPNGREARVPKVIRGADHCAVFVPLLSAMESINGLNSALPSATIAHSLCLFIYFA
jgi:hypothetical protein